MFLQTIAIPDQHFDAYARDYDWLRKYIFPGSLLASLHGITAIVAPGHARCASTRCATSAPTTPAPWRRGASASHGQRDAVRRLGFDDRFLRMWDFYLASCEAAFAVRYLSNLQLVMRRPLSAARTARRRVTWTPCASPSSALGLRAWSAPRSLPARTRSPSSRPATTSADTPTPIAVERFGRVYAVDSGFIVFNERTYPNFIRLLDGLGVASHPTTMSFSVRDERDGLEYNGTDLNRLFAQRRNLLRPSFLRMVARNRALLPRGAGVCSSAGDDLTLGAYLARRAAIRGVSSSSTSCPWGRRCGRPIRTTLREFPARYLRPLLRQPRLPRMVATAPAGGWSAAARSGTSSR